jgi:predicted GNAT superfamily acetyltransferase
MEMFATQLRDARPEDFTYIDSLRKKEGSALGFIPKDAYLSVLNRTTVANRERWRYQRILVTVDNNDLTGFCYASYASNYANIIQIVVQNDARRWHRALMLADAVEKDAITYGKNGLTCRVAYDLESNHFWRAIGYEPVSQVISTWLNQKESKSKRPLWVYKKEIGGLFQ